MSFIYQALQRIGGFIWEQLGKPLKTLSPDGEPQEKCKYILDSVFPSQEIRDEVMNYIHSLQQ